MCCRKDVQPRRIFICLLIKKCLLYTRFQDTPLKRRTKGMNSQKCFLTYLNQYLVAFLDLEATVIMSVENKSIKSNFQGKNKILTSDKWTEKCLLKVRQALSNVMTYGYMLFSAKRYIKGQVLKFSICTIKCKKRKINFASIK